MSAEGTRIRSAGCVAALCSIREIRDIRFSCLLKSAAISTAVSLGRTASYN
jgi:hypothetical protein